VLVGAGAAAGLAAVQGAARRLPRAWGAPQPSIVVVLADDMRFDYRTMMDVFTTGEWARQWIDCTSTACQTPMCAPSRASMFTGSYSWRTPVVSNPTAVNMPTIDAGATLATRMSTAGYRTALVGKYMNLYPFGLGSSYVPPGWTDWRSLKSGAWNLNGMHETDYCFKWASDWVLTVPAAQPFLLWVAPKLPHEPAKPPARYANALPTLPPEPPSFDEADVSDKPAVVRRKPRLSAAKAAEFRRLRLAQGRSMLALNDGMKTLLASLRQAGRLESTIVVFASDNSFMMGEHRLESKGFVYEESVHVPFLVRYPGVAGRREAGVISLVDLPTTLCALAGTTAPGTDGVNLVPLLTSGTAVRAAAYLTPPRVLGWHGVRTARYKYAEYTDSSGFRELYDLATDPFELQNIAGRTDAATVLVRQQMAALLQQLKLPTL
jgi:arylsulfatase A-like enzyme